jgi:hypothetical protein
MIHYPIREQFERTLPDAINCDSTDVEFSSQLEVNIRIYYEPVVNFVASDLVPFEASKQTIDDVVSLFWCQTLLFMPID